ncbi:MAG: metalloregulator ArsR/SmtB family transcription factor [Ferrovibrio sp.]|uniref:ArsR/SmtB family transcription factor n=1 Tax=Ferrovibrio sp. TaxID=1917215 RepID=UPI00261A024F|nr:metalloregulator ArsR/SmtB family transcription factor [Ferrovibrio sp.]MCW0233324.1 metalloregulator ArsR/SmtB family transcription factor [Ferrovibrio sp.]
MFDLSHIEDAEVIQLADMFRLLGDPSRLRLVVALCAGPCPASAAAEAAGLSPQLASHHLRLLKAARLVRGIRRGRQIYYDLADDHVRHMLADMAEHVAEPHKDETALDDHLEHTI